MPTDVRIQGSLIGSKLGGYQVEALIGRGAMASVYLARDTKLNRHVALKVLLGSLAKTSSIVKQFHQEAQAAAPLNHPNIVRIYSAGIEAGVPFIAMEFVDGEPLDRFLKRKGKVSWDVALHIGAQVALALDCAHQHGIVHRDVKPSNILVDRRGGVRLTDFGIARMTSGSGGGGGVVGTPQYMSPEQATGDEVWPTSDLFSLGVTLYQMISSDMPFKGESSMELIRSICEEEPPRLNKLVPDVPDDVARMVAYLLEKEPSGRPASAKVAYGLIHRLQKHRGGSGSAVAESLTAFLKEEMEPRPFSSLERKEAETRKKSSKVRRRLKRKWLTGGLIAQAIIIGVLALGAFVAGPLAAARSREKAPASAATLNLASVDLVQPGMRRYGLANDGHRIDGLTWVDSGNAVVVRTRGQRGTLADGTVGLLSIDLAQEAVLSLSPPSLGSSPGNNRTRMENGYFTGAMEQGVPVFAPSDRPDTAVLLVQDWNEATPRTEILYSTPVGTVAGPDARPYVAVQPSGERLCITLYDAESGYHYLVEHTIANGPVGTDDERRTGPRSDIFPETVQYLPDGRRIAYLRRNALGVVELWMISSGSAELDGRRIASGLARGPLAFSPDGAFAAATVANADGTTEVALFEFQAGAIIARYGAGNVSSQAWLPDGSGFIFAGAAGDPQLMFASATLPYAARRVTSRPGGLGPVYAVDPTTGSVAAADRGTTPAGVYVLDAGAVSP